MTKPCCDKCRGRSPRGFDTPSILVCRDPNCECHKSEWGARKDLDNQMKSNLNIKVPRGWRKGQTIFNFLWYLRECGYDTEVVGWNPNGTLQHSVGRMADPFHIGDKELEKYYREFLVKHGAGDEIRI